MANNKVQLSNGTVVIDLSSDTVTSASHIKSGLVGHLADGTTATGTLVEKDVKSVTYNLTSGVTANIATAEVVTDQGFSVKLKAPVGYSLSGVTVTMGGVDITEQVFEYDEAGSGGGGATEHTIYLELNDGTDATILVYYDDAFIGTIITDSAPATYGGKTVDSASLDGVAWYRATGYTTLYEGTPAFYTDAGNYFWIPELANVQPTLNSVWRITIDGTAYICVAKNSLAGVIVGNPVHVGGADDGSGVPVAFYNYNSQAWSGDTLTFTTGGYSVKIERKTS